MGRLCPPHYCLPLRIQKPNDICANNIWYREELQVNNYEIVVKIFHISHNLTWYSASAHKITRINPVCSTYELTKQFMQICVKIAQSISKRITCNHFKDPNFVPFLITGAASLNAKMNGMIAMRTIIYFLVTSLLSAIIGLILVLLIHPGNPETKAELGNGK